MSTALTRAEPKRDRYGRYLIPDPDTGREVAWTRATTLAETLDDRYNLELWKLRTVATGLAQRADLLAMVAAHQGDKRALDRVCEQALEAGKASVGANLGTALHALTERIDRGEDALVLDALRADIDAYQRAIIEAGLRIATLPDGRLAREVIVLCPELGVAGTADHLFAGDVLTVGDLKTGASAIDWAMTSIAIQLAVYAHATHIWDPATETLVEKPATNTDTAIVIHLPAGQGVCTLHDVDIAAGWEAAQHAVWVRRWRKRRDLSTPRKTVKSSTSVDPTDDPFVGVSGDGPLPPLTPEPTQGHAPGFRPAVASPIGSDATAGEAPAPAATTVTFPRVEWIADRINQLPTSGRHVLAIRWPKGAAPTVKQMRAVPHRDYSDDEVAAIEAVLVPIERDHECPFPPADPGRAAEPRHLTKLASAEDVERGPSPLPPGHTGSSAAAPHEGDIVSDDDIAALAKAFDELSKKPDSTGMSPRTQARVWLTQMAKAGCPLELSRVRSRRRWAIARAVIKLAVYDDEVARACLTHTLDTDVNESVTTGVVLAGLTIEQADRLASMADAIDAGTLAVVYDDDGNCRVVDLNQR